MTRDPASAVPPSGPPAPRPFVPTPARPAVPVTPAFGAVPFAPRPRLVESAAAEGSTTEPLTSAGEATPSPSEAGSGSSHVRGRSDATDGSEYDAWAAVPIVAVELLAPDEPTTGDDSTSVPVEAIVAVESLAPDEGEITEVAPAVARDGGAETEAARDMDDEPAAPVESISADDLDDLVPIESLAPDDTSEDAGTFDAQANVDPEHGTAGELAPNADEAGVVPIELLAPGDENQIRVASPASEPLSTVLPGWEGWEAEAERATGQHAAVDVAEIEGEPRVDAAVRETPEGASGAGQAEVDAEVDSIEAESAGTSSPDADDEEDAEFAAHSPDGGEEYANGGWDGHAPFPTDVFGFPDVPAGFTLAAARGVADPGAWPSDEEWRRSDAERGDDHHGDEPLDPSLGVERSDAGAAAYGRGGSSDAGVRHLAAVLERLASELRAGALGPISIAPEEPDEVHLTALLLAVVRRERGGR